MFLVIGSLYVSPTKPAVPVCVKRSLLKKPSGSDRAVVRPFAFAAGLAFATGFFVFVGAAFLPFLAAGFLDEAREPLEKSMATRTAPCADSRSSSATLPE